MFMFSKAVFWAMTGLLLVVGLFLAIALSKSGAR